jgi:hypothetical protein
MIAPFVDDNDDVTRHGADIPEYPHDPRELFPQSFRWGTNSPGFWPSSDKGFVQLQYVDSVNRSENQSSELAWTEEAGEREDMLLSKAIFASFGQCLAQSTHLGFGPFHDPDHPIAVQTVLTDGEKFMFCAYQLGKTALFSEPNKDSPTNVLWHSEEKPLLVTDPETAELTVDTDVLKTLAKFYLREPSVQGRNSPIFLQFFYLFSIFFLNYF